MEASVWITILSQLMSSFRTELINHGQSSSVNTAMDVTHQVTHQVQPHLFQRILRNMWGHRARWTSQSIKKPIESLLIVLRPFLNTLMLAEPITCCGKLFHWSTTRSEKKKRLKSNEQRFFGTLAEWPRVLLTGLSVKYRQNGVNDSPLYMRKTSSKSAWCRLSSSDHKPNWARRVWYGRCFIPGTIRVNLCCTRSNKALSLT